MHMTSRNPEPRPKLSDRFLLRISDGRLVDGLWIGVSNVTDSDSASILGRVKEALRTIRTYDPRRYGRLRRDLQRIWVRLQIAGNTGLYNFDLGACELDPRYVLRADVTPSDMASVIVHEATHARLYGLGFSEPLRNRIEAACRKQEHAFSEHLPQEAGDKIRDKLRRMDQVREDFWSDASHRQRRVTGVEEALQYLNVPRWSLPFLRLIRGVVRVIRALVRAIARLRAA